MIRYSKSVRSAIAVMSYLAEYYDNGQTRASAGDIAQRRRLSKALVAKLLGQLSQKGLVRSTPGPNGGYWLNRPPDQISIYDVACCFDDPARLTQCPFNPEGCDPDNLCPLHRDFSDLNHYIIIQLKGMTLRRFT